ncbi:hypothetical protein PYW07_002466 [Mythimna separata]|uniref:Putative ionotropic receptor ligand binding domain-containing protein n=1 Tax=Mythimna separata TaxID=271217 RepID=A0AAD8DU58_MYTSE|nr:hypothetical protein PYW07_002466 [Mythimna separata]
MEIVCYLMSVFYAVVQCQVTLLPYHLKNERLDQCIISILNKYFTEQQELTYVNMFTDDEELLKTIHSTQNFSLLMRSTTHQSFLPNQGYLINSKNVPTFKQYFEYLMTDPTWNPYARFLIIVESLKNDQLRVIFDELLRLHVNNVVILNGTDDAHLFTYNPFENYACGKYYNDVISVGLCSQTTQDLYPNKLVTGLRNCTFKASLAHRPPFSINPLRIDEDYFIEAKEVTYVGNKFRDEELLKAINNANIISVVTKRVATKSPILHQAFLISSSGVTSFTTHFTSETKQSTWNPTARFLLLIKNLKEDDLRTIFDTFLKLHANNVVVVNATDDAHLYTYNPFDNYNCGKRYDTITSFGKCAEASSLNLYPNKLVTGLQNCTFNVLITQWPPYTILTSNESSVTPRELRNGVEVYLLNLLGEMLGFDINIVNEYGDADDFSTVSPDMQAVGVLKRIQDNEVDMHISGMLLTPSRAAAFSYVYGHLVYTDEIRPILSVSQPTLLKNIKFQQKKIYTNISLHHA